MQRTSSRLFNRQWSGWERPAEAAKEAVLAGGLNRKTINGFFAVLMCTRSTSSLSFSQKTGLQSGLLGTYGRRCGRRLKKQLTGRIEWIRPVEVDLRDGNSEMFSG